MCKWNLRKSITDLLMVSVLFLQFFRLYAECINARAFSLVYKFFERFEVNFFSKTIWLLLQATYQLCDLSIESLIRCPTKFSLKRYQLEAFRKIFNGTKSLDLLYTLYIILYTYLIHLIHLCIQIWALNCRLFQRNNDGDASNIHGQFDIRNSIRKRMLNISIIACWLPVPNWNRPAGLPAVAYNLDLQDVRQTRFYWKKNGLLHIFLNPLLFARNHSNFKTLLDKVFWLIISLIYELLK